MSEHTKSETEAKPHHPNPSSTQWVSALFILLGLVVAVTAYNQLQISDLNYGVAKFSALAVSASAAQAAPQPAGTQASGTNLQALADKIIPKGVPKIYGAELKVSYDDPVAAMTVLAPLDDGTQLNSEQLQRYTKITLQISCEYCCGAESIVFPNGQAACGCQHSYVMRGLAKYLLTKHGNEYTDEQVLEELGKWKTLFFPKQILTKALQFESAGKAINTVDLTSNKYRGFTASAASATSATGGGANVANLPNMVGGC